MFLWAVVSFLFQQFDNKDGIPHVSPSDAELAGRFVPTFD